VDNRGSTWCSGRGGQVTSDEKQRATLQLDVGGRERELGEKGREFGRIL
jgi:hypothetical protein